MKKHKKSYEKLLTKAKKSDNICKRSARETREKLRDDLLEVKKRDFKEAESDLKKLEKSSKKVLTNKEICDILFELSRKSSELDLEN